MASCNVIDSGTGVPVEAWNKNVPLQDEAREQVRNFARRRAWSAGKTQT